MTGKTDLHKSRILGRIGLRVLLTVGVMVGGLFALPGIARADAVLHTHSWTYSGTGTTIRATCGNTDGGHGTPEYIEMQIAAPTRTTYGGGGDAGATLTGLNEFNTATGHSIAETDIKYVGRAGTTYGESTTQPTEPGFYTAKITVEEKNAYVDYEIEKADPVANAPTGLTATYGQTLSDISLADKNPAGNTDGTWTWADGSTGVGAVGNNSFYANFTPADDTHYKSVSSIEVTVTVGRAANPANVTDSAVVMRGGNTINLTSKVTMNGAEGAVSYEISGEANGCTLVGSTLTSGTNTGSVTVNVTIAQDDKYLALAATPITVTITEKNTQEISTAESITAGYGDTGITINATTTDGGGDISYAVTTGDDVIDVNASTGELTIKKAGSAVVTVTAAENLTFAQASKEVIVTVNKKDVAITAKNQSIYVGGSVPTLEGEEFYTVTGLLGGDTITTPPTLQYQKNDAAVTPDNSREGNYDIVPFGASAGDNYNITHSKGTLTISYKATQIITADNVTATFGDTGKKVEASTSGDGGITYAVTSGDDVIDVNASTGDLTIKKAGSATVTVTASETATCAQATKEVTVTINKASNPLTYTTSQTVTKNYSTSAQTETLSEATGGVGDVTYEIINQPDGDHFTLRGTTLTIGANTSAGAYEVTVRATAAGNDNYERATADSAVAVTISAIDPTTPTGLNATYGQTLANVALPTGWAWIDSSTTSVGNVGTNTFKANYTSTDPNYNSKENVDVSVTVGQADNPATVTNTASVRKGGNTIDLAGNVTKNEASGAVSYAINGATNGCTLNGSELTSGADSGTVTVNVTIAEETNYKALTVAITVTITDKTPRTITADNVTATYGDTGKKINASTSGDGAISFAVKSGSAVTVNPSTGDLTIVKAGEAVITVTAAETDTYAQATKDVTVTVSKAVLTVLPVAGQGKEYRESDPTALSFTPTGFVNGDNSSVIRGKLTRQAGETRGEYSYDVSNLIADNYTYTLSGQADKFTIRQKTITSSMITLDPSSFVYDGTEKELKEIIVKQGDYKLTKDSDFTVDASSVTKAKEVKEYTVTVTGKGDYTGSASKTWKIENAASTVTAPQRATSLTYNGSYQALLSKAGYADHATMKYKLGQNGDWVTSITDTKLKAKNAGTYTIYYKAFGDTGYPDSDEKSIEVTIGRKSLSSVTITLSPSSYVYTGDYQVPDITVKDGSTTLVEDTDYYVDIDSDWYALGSATENKTYTLRLYGDGNYNGYATKTWTINKSSASGGTTTYSTVTPSSSVTPQTVTPTPAATISPSSASTPSSSSSSAAQEGEAEEAGSENKPASSVSEPQAVDTGVSPEALQQLADSTRLTDADNTLKSIIGEAALNSLKASGQNPKVKLSATPMTVISSEEKRITEESINALASSNLMPGAFLDVSLMINTTGTWQFVANTANPVKFVISVPEELQKKSEEFYALRIHLGQATLLKDQDTDPKTVTLDSDRFSTYVLMYPAKAATDPQTNGASVKTAASKQGSLTLMWIVVAITLFAVMVFLLIYYIYTYRRENAEYEDEYNRRQE